MCRYGRVLTGVAGGRMMKLWALQRAVSRWVGSAVGDSDIAYL